MVRRALKPLIGCFLLFVQEDSGDLVCDSHRFDHNEGYENEDVKCYVPDNSFERGLSKAFLFPSLFR